MYRPVLTTHILDQLSQILSSEFPSYDCKVSLSINSTFSDLQLDSLDVYSFISAVESEFAIKISDEDLETIKSIGDLLKFLPNEP